MPYRVYAEIVDPKTGKKERGTGVIDVTAATRRDALAKSRDLKGQGFTVTITEKSK